MRAIRVSHYVKGPRDLGISDQPDPKPSADEYLIEVHAAAANFFDILQIQGRYQHQPPLPWIAGCEFAGIVLSTPTSKPDPRFPIGTRVFGAGQGAFATCVTSNEESLHPVPAGWSFTEAAGLFVTAPTSYAALVVRAKVKPGDYVLIHAAAGGVGLAAVQIAKAHGAIVIATASSERKLAVARSFGADYTVDYRDADWPSKVRELTPSGRGVDIVYDPVGLVEKSIKCVAWNGRILVIGFAAGAIEKVAMNKVLLKNISVVGLHWGMYGIMERETVQSVWEGIFRLVKNGKFKATVFTDGEYVGLEAVSKALEALGGRETWGKVVVVVKMKQEGWSKL